MMALVVPQMRRQERESCGRHVLWKTCAARCCAWGTDALRGFKAALTLTCELTSVSLQPLIQ